ncbi:MAG: pyridoxal phosphate-dependent aminotransferase [Promethearchaeota archaeon]
MKELSNRLTSVPKSGIRKLFDLLSQAKDVISLGIGQPDFPSPSEVVEGSIKALKQGVGSVYAPTRGVPEFKKLISEKLSRENGVETDPEENVIVTPGGSGGITLAFSVLCNPGDEVLLFSPNFISYFYVARFFGAKIVEVARGEDMSPDLDDLKKRISPKTKAILINTPNNPTGYAMKRKELEEIASACIEHDLYLISDEVYEKFVYDGIKHVSPASLNGMNERTITLNALSKTFSTTGYRIGYVAASGKIISLMENFIQYTSGGSNHPCQFGGIEAMNLLKRNPRFLDDIVASYEKKRDTCYKRLNEMGLSSARPGGAFYIMPSVKGTEMTGSEFSEGLVKEKSVAVIPGNIFGSFSGDHVRISYALDDLKLAEALDRIDDFVNKASS